MALRRLTEKEISELLAHDAAVIVTQTENVNGETKSVVRRIPFAAFAASLGADLSFDEDEQTLYLTNPDGERIGDGTTVQTGINGLQMYTETDDTGTQYLILADADGVELCRTEFTVSGSGGSTAYVCRLINGMGSLKLSFPSGQACQIGYSFFEYYGNEQTAVNATCEVYTKTATTDYVLRRTDTIQQGTNAVTITPYLQPGTNYVKLQVTAGESGTVKVLVFTVNVVDISLTSSFDATQAYNSSISFMYRVTGRNISKVMHFKIDDEPEWTTDIGTSHNVQLTEIINLAKYGHGDHILKCWFVTGDGAISPTLTYDIMFDMSSVTPIISSVFDVDEVDYGDLIQVQYCVFTHGSDYTSEVDLDIYTLDESGDKVYFSQIALANVVNESLQSWNVTEYPPKGVIYLEITAGSARKTFRVVVNENTGNRDLSGVSTRLIASYSASGRSNSDVNKAVMNAGYTSNDDITTIIPGRLTGFNWRSNGWLSDNNGYPVLRVSGGAEVDIDLPFFSAGWVDASGHQINLSGTPTRAGRTFEVAFATSGVTDEDDEIITLWDETSGIGIKVFPSKAYLLSGTMSVVRDADGNIINKNAIPYVPFSSASKVRLTFVIEEVGHYVETIADEESGATRTENKQLLCVYVNGQLSRAIAYTTDDFTTSDAKPKMKTESCILDVYSMRLYDYALSDSDVLKNYIADLPAISERIDVYDRNAIVDDNGRISLDLSRPLYPCMVLTGRLSEYKGNKVKIGVLLYKPDSEAAEEYVTEWEFMDTDGDGKYGNVNNVQGTSSQYYIKKNYKITFYRWRDDIGKFEKVKVSILPGDIPVSTICVKADYMSPDSANTGNANFWQSVLSEETPPQETDSRVQTSIKGYPILMFQRDTATDAPSFIGRYNLNNDKGNAEAFGLENDGDSGRETKCQKWEYCDNSEDICNFLTDQLRALRTDSDGQYYEAWEDALESCYPDQGDLEDEGIRPNTNYIQMMYSWVVQRANFLGASIESGTGGEYCGVTYDTEHDMKLAIFRREFERHFNLHHTLHYFIANEVSLMVDNLAKNLFMTCYDLTAENVVDREGTPVNIDDITVNGAVNISGIDWEKSTFAIWYPTLYDMDSCLGADNNGFDQFPYYKEMWDTYNTGFVVNGHNSLFWRLVYAAYYAELKALYCAFRDTDKTLTPALYTTAMIDELTEKLPIVAVNEDERFKYIDAFEGGYYDQSANDGRGGWVYTQSFLYLAKGTMASYHRDFISKRFAMLDSKYMSDAFTQDHMTVRINRPGTSSPEQLAFNVSPCQAMYCYTEWGNSGSYIGGKCLEGEHIPMKPIASGMWADIVLAVYGASHIKSLGDLSVIIPSKFINLSRCVNLTELIVGSDDDGYENSALDSISDVSYLKMLQRLNICNCTALSGTVDLSNCDLIEEVYATGSAISAIVLPEGGYLKKLHLPSGVTALNIVDHAGLADFSMDSYSGLTRLRVENTPNIDTAAILDERGLSIQRLRLIGVHWSLGSEKILRVLADARMAGKAIDANGVNVADITVYPTITGTVTINRIQKSLYDKLHTLYPNLIIKATTQYHVVRFFNEGALFNTQEIDDGQNAVMPDTPLKAATVQYVYSFSGWSEKYTAVSSDLNIHARYSSSIQKYDMRFWEDESMTSLLANAEGVAYGTSYTYTGELPTRSGYVLCGWRDEDGNECAYISHMPNDSAKIDENGVPLVIDLFPIWSPIEMPSVSKDFMSLTPGERLFAAIAIQNGSAPGCTVTYYEDTCTYIIYESETNVSVSVAIGDTKQWTLGNGETITQQVIGFNHDYSDLAEQNTLGITYAMKNCLATQRRMNPGYKHAFHYRLGEDEPVVSDLADHSSATDAALTHSHIATEDEVAAGFVDMTVLGPTYLDKIIVRHIDDSTTTWYFGKEGFYCGTDSEAFTKNGAGQDVTTCGWYKSDLDDSEEFYKIGKILQALGCDIVNWQGSIGLYGWATTPLQWATLTGKSANLTGFGGLKIDTTGTDTLNTAENNPFNGNGKSRVTYCASYESDWNNFTEVSEGTIISIPVSYGDVVTVIAYGLSRNWGGWDKTEMCAWANQNFFNQLPLGLRCTIVPTMKKFSVGNRSYAMQKGLYDLWLLSNAEIGGYTSNSPYKDEGKRYTIFTDNNSRIKLLADGAGAACGWWERTPHISSSYYFGNCDPSGYPYNLYGLAYGAFGVCLGFCSGEAKAQPI